VRARLVALPVALLLVAAAAGCVPNPTPGWPDHVAPRPAATAVDQWQQFEAGVDVTPRPANPFDPAQADVQAVFQAPDGRRVHVIGFWYQAYDRALVNGSERLTATGDPYFMARFTPTTAGRWLWWWHVKIPSGTYDTPARPLDVAPAAGRGFIRRSAQDPRYLAYDDGSSYFAVGENLGWADRRGTYAYDSWLSQLAAQHATFARLWMPSFGFGIEWDDTGLGDYTNRLDRAWQLDRVLDEAGARGIAIELSLLNHGAFSTVYNAQWANNPYNAANGGPIATPAAFFTDATARRYFVQRLRYIVARWGASTDLLAWELWNEVDLTDGYNGDAVAAWHRDMVDVIHRLDPYRHLVTTSHALFVSDPKVWSGGGLDFTQIHHYSHGGFTWFTNLSQDVVQWSRDRIATTGRPVLFAELGVNSLGPDETRADDPTGMGIHDGLWAGVVSGGFGTAMTWWWDNLVDVEPDLYYPMFGSVARFVHGVAFDTEGFTYAAPAARTATGRPLVVYGLQGDPTALWWLKDDAAQTDTPARVDITDATVDIGPLAKGTWCARWYDTWNGTWGPSFTVPSGAATLAVPPFHGDIALRAQAC
jgi:hypothetical protein